MISSLGIKSIPLFIFLTLIFFQDFHLTKNRSKVFDFFKHTRVARSGLLIFFDRDHRVKHHFNRFIDNHGFSSNLKIDKTDDGDWDRTAILYPIARALTLLKDQDNFSDKQKRRYADLLVNAYLRCGQSIAESTKQFYDVIVNTVMFIWATIVVVFCLLVSKDVLIDFFPIFLLVFMFIAGIMNVVLYDRLINSRLNLVDSETYTDPMALKPLEEALVKFQKSDDAAVVNKILHANKVHENKKQSKNKGSQESSNNDHLVDFDFENADPQLMIRQYAEKALEQVRDRLMKYVLDEQRLDDKPTDEVLHASQLIQTIRFFNALSISTFGLVSQSNDINDFVAKVVWLSNTLKCLDGLKRDKAFVKLVDNMNAVSEEILQYLYRSINEAFENKITHFRPVDDSSSALDRLAELDFIQRSFNDKDA